MAKRRSRISKEEAQRDTPEDSSASPRKRRVVVAGDAGSESETEARLVGEPVPVEEAKRRWPKRYQGKVMHYVDLYAGFLFACRENLRPVCKL